MFLSQLHSKKKLKKVCQVLDTLLVSSKMGLLVKIDKPKATTTTKELCVLLIKDLEN